LAASAQTSATIQPITVQPRKKLSMAMPSADGVCRTMAIRVGSQYMANQEQEERHHGEPPGPMP
jgi:hypothetical protein